VRNSFSRAANIACWAMFYYFTSMFLAVGLGGLSKTKLVLFPILLETMM
jgi:hypothetical protein